MGVLIENRSQTRDQITIIHEIIGGDVAPHAGSIIDTANYPAGVSFIVVAFNLETTDLYTFIIEESDDSAMSGAMPIETARLTGEISELNHLNTNNIQGNFVNAIGIVNTLRYVKLTGQATVDGTSGTVIAMVRQGVDSAPVKNTGIFVNP